MKHQNVSDLEAICSFLSNENILITKSAIKHEDCHYSQNLDRQSDNLIFPQRRHRKQLVFNVNIL